MTESKANSIYDILVELGGASERDRSSFVFHHTKGDCNEYRFQGKFGFGGKFWSRYLDVNYYSENQTDELDELQQTINDKIMEALYGDAIGKQVDKDSNKPFKSGSKVNTVKGLIRHPYLRIPSYTFEEDDSYVECRRCKIVEE